MACFIQTQCQCKNILLLTSGRRKTNDFSKVTSLYHDIARFLTNFPNINQLARKTICSITVHGLENLQLRETNCKPTPLDLCYPSSLYFCASKNPNSANTSATPFHRTIYSHLRMGQAVKYLIPDLRRFLPVSR